MLKKSVKTRVQKWLDFRRHIAFRCKVTFQYHLSNRGYFGKVIFDGRQVGVVVAEDGDFSKLIGKKVDADGDILDKHGNVIGRAERKEEEEPEAPEEAIDEDEAADRKRAALKRQFATAAGSKTKKRKF